MGVGRRVMGYGSWVMGSNRRLRHNAALRAPLRTFHFPIFNFHFSIFTFQFALLLLAPPLWAQDGSQPPPASGTQTSQPAAPSPVSPPPGLSGPGPAGETPQRPSEPPTGYKPGAVPSVEVVGGAALPFGPNTLKLDAEFCRVEFEKGEAVLVTGRGNVRATYQNFSVTSTNATADLRTKIATFTDNVVLNVDGQDVRGEKLTINLDTREWIFESARSDIRPESFPSLIRAPVFLSGKTITGLAEKMVTVKGGGFTTCNLAHPHYFIDSTTATVWPDRKLIARNLTFSALGRHIFRIGKLTIPLRQAGEAPAVVPRIGQTAEEGMFLKTAYTVAATPQNSGALKLDLMSRKGVGMGIEDSYSLRRGLGSLNLYRLSDRNRNLNTLTGRFTHEQRFGTVKATLTSDYRSNSYQYSPHSTSLGNELRFTRARPGASTSLGIRETVDRGFGRFEYLTSNLQHTQSFSAHSSATISFDYFCARSPVFVQGTTTTAANAQLVSRLDYGQQRDRYDWHLRLNKIHDLSDEAFISQAGSRFAGAERLPELELSTTSDRLHKKLPFGLPARLSVAVGRYREDLGRVETDRALVDLDIPSKAHKLSDRLTLTAGGGFRQYAYGNNTAQYALDASADLTRKIGKTSSAALTYRFLEPHGFTPFRFDFIGRYNILNARLNLQESGRFKISLYGGRNFSQRTFPWQDLTARVLYAPSDRYLLYTAAGYDLNRRQWRALINQLRVRLPHDFKLDLGTRYDIERSKFASVKSVLDMPVGGKWRIRANSGYNGFTKNFDYRNVQIVRDLHCWELALTWVDQTGSWQERGFGLSLRIKAFPIFDSFSTGQFGQSLDTSVGQML